MNHSASRRSSRHGGNDYGSIVNIGWNSGHQRNRRASSNHHRRTASHDRRGTCILRLASKMLLRGYSKRMRNKTAINNNTKHNVRYPLQDFQQISQKEKAQITWLLCILHRRSSSIMRWRRSAIALLRGFSRALAST